MTLQFSDYDHLQKMELLDHFQSNMKPQPCFANFMSYFVHRVRMSLETSDHLTIWSGMVHWYLISPFLPKPDLFQCNKKDYATFLVPFYQHHTYWTTFKTAEKAMPYSVHSMPHFTYRVRMPLETSDWGETARNGPLGPNKSLSTWTKLSKQQGMPCHILSIPWECP